MQSSQLQKDKLKLIEKIMETEDKLLIDYFNDMISNMEGYQLNESQKMILEEATEKYYSGEEPSFSWEEVKANARKNYDEKRT